MIPKAAITAWAVSRPWPSPQAIEQDLLLARMIVEIYNDPLLADELVFRGGTCIHQVMLATRSATAKTSTSCDPLTALSARYSTRSAS